MGTATRVGQVPEQCVVSSTCGRQRKHRNFRGAGYLSDSSDPIADQNLDVVWFTVNRIVERNIGKVGTTVVRKSFQEQLNL